MKNVKFEKVRGEESTQAHQPTFPLPPCLHGFELPCIISGKMGYLR